MQQLILSSSMDTGNTSFAFPTGSNAPPGPSSQQFTHAGGLTAHMSSTPSATVTSNSTPHYPTPQKATGTQRGFHQQTQQSPHCSPPHAHNTAHSLLCHSRDVHPTWVKLIACHDTEGLD